MFFRHDTITPHSGVKESDCEQFMTNDLLPFFSEHYKGPMRTPRADIKSQSLLKAEGRPREYLWITSWDGSAESVSGASFEHARMTPTEATDAMLKKLETLGKRASEYLFAERASVDVATNT